VAPTAPPALTGDAVASAAAYWDAWLAFRQRYDRTPGVQAALWHGDGLVHSAAHGMADVETGTALTGAHLFRVASHSKTFTATAVLQLVEAGRLRLDDRLDAWLPDLVGRPVGERTLREALAHGGGVIRDGHDGDFWHLYRPFPDAAALAATAVDRADVLPANQEFKYSNVAYGLVGQVIEAVTGASYAAVVQREIVDRLGLERTGPDYDPARAADYATGYSALAYADRRIPIEQIPTGALAPATGFCSTAEDLCRYASAHFLGDERLLGDHAKRQLQRTEWAVAGGDTQYGLGFQISEAGGRRLVGHSGGFPGHITRTLFDPEARLAVSVLTNAVDGPAEMLATAAVRLVDLAARPAQPDTAPDAVAADRLCGRYANLWGVMDIVRLGASLYVLDPTGDDPAAEPLTLEMTGPTTLRMGHEHGFGSTGETLELVLGDDGRVRSGRGSSGLSWYPYDVFAATVATRERVTLGAPLRPAAG
jgi:CubicO group peptidase (beta-lactamase class C family)